MAHRKWPVLGAWLEELQAASARNGVSIEHVKTSARVQLWDQGYAPIDALLRIASPPAPVMDMPTPPKSGPTP